MIFVICFLFFVFFALRFALCALPLKAQMFNRETVVG